MSDKPLVGYGAIVDEDTEIIDEDDDAYQKKKQPEVLLKNKEVEAPRPRDDDDSDSSDDESSAGRPTSRPPLPKAAPSLVSSSYGKEGESDTDSDSNEEVDLSHLLKTGAIQQSVHRHNTNAENLGSAANSPASVDTNDSTLGLDEKDDRKKGISDPLDSVKLPPEPEGRCSRSLQDKIAKMLEKKYKGKLSLNEHVQKKKDFRNPSIYEKLVLYCGINETGTNYPRHLYSPSSWGPESYYDALGKAQKEAHEKREKEKQKRAQVEFVTATKKATGTLISSQKCLDEKQKKGSKWDTTKSSESSTITNSSDIPIKKPKLSA